MSVGFVKLARPSAQTDIHRSRVHRGGTDRCRPQADCQIVTSTVSLRATGETSTLRPCPRGVVSVTRRGPAPAKALTSRVSTQTKIGVVQSPGVRIVVASTELDSLGAGTLMPPNAADSPRTWHQTNTIPVWFSTCASICARYGLKASVRGPEMHYATFWRPSWLVCTALVSGRVSVKLGGAWPSNFPDGAAHG